MGSLATSLRGNADLDEVVIRLVAHVALASADRVVVAIDVKSRKRDRNKG